MLPSSQQPKNDSAMTQMEKQTDTHKTHVSKSEHTTQKKKKHNHQEITSSLTVNLSGQDGTKRNGDHVQLHVDSFFDIMALMANFDGSLRGITLRGEQAPRNREFLVSLVMRVANADCTERARLVKKMYVSTAG